MNLCKKYTAKPWFFLFTVTTIVSDNSSCFRKNIETNLGN